MDSKDSGAQSDVLLGCVGILALLLLCQESGRPSEKQQAGCPFSPKIRAVQVGWVYLETPVKSMPSLPASGANSNKMSERAKVLAKENRIPPLSIAFHPLKT